MASNSLRKFVSLFLSLLQRSKLRIIQRKEIIFEFLPRQNLKGTIFEFEINNKKISLKKTNDKKLESAISSLFDYFSSLKFENTKDIQKTILNFINFFDFPIALFIENKCFVENKSFKNIFIGRKDYKKNFTQLLIEQIEKFYRSKTKKYLFRDEKINANIHLFKAILFKKKIAIVVIYEGTSKENNEENRRLYFDFCPFPFLDITNKFEISYANPKACEIFGLSSQEIKNKSFLDLFPVNYREEVLDSLKKSVRSGMVVEIKIKSISKFSKEEYFNWKFIPVLSKNSKELSLICIAESMSQNEFENKINLALFKISEAATKIDDLNELFKSIHSTIQELMNAKNFYIAIVDEERKHIDFPYFIDEFEPPPGREPFRNGLTEKVILSGEPMLIKFENQNQEPKHIELIGPPCKVWLGIPLKMHDFIFGVMALQDYYDENAYGFKELETLKFVSEQISFAIFRKISEQKLKDYAAELERNKSLLEIKNIELQKWQRELIDELENKNKFFSIFSHDLKNPFLALLGFSEFLMTQFKELSDNEKLEYIESIYFSSRNIYELLENLLKWAKYELGYFEQRPEQINIYEILCKVISLYSFFLNKKNIVVKNNLKADCKAYADPNAVFSIIQNLISNAVKFSPSNSQIHIDCHSKSNFIFLSVLNYGQGISQEEVEKIFNAKIYYTTEGTQGEKGTGLGLSIAKLLVEKNGGALFIESEKNNYCKITFSLPISAK